MGEIIYDYEDKRNIPGTFEGSRAELHENDEGIGTRFGCQEFCKLPL